MKRYAIPLLASAIRKSSAVAVAMLSKGFTGKWERPYYVQLRVSWKDWLLLLLLIGGICGCYLLSWHMDSVRLYRGEL